MDRVAAEQLIESIFSQYVSNAPVPSDPQQQSLIQALSDGKLYELFVLAHVVEGLSVRGFSIVFRGSSLKFKSSPGMIKTSDPHFEVVAPFHGQNLWLFVDIEFETLGRKQGAQVDRSRRHEIDIAVVTVQAGYPEHSDILLGVECKAFANFRKSIVKEVLGVRRELSFLGDPVESELSMCCSGHSTPVHVPADPRSEFRLAFIDPVGTAYSESPKQFGIEFWHLQP